MLKVLLKRTALTLSLAGLAALPAAADGAPSTGMSRLSSAPIQIAEEKKAGEEKKAEVKNTEEKKIGLVTLKVALADKVIGKKDAPITILAFESLTCPACRAFHTGPWPRIKKEYVDTGKAKVVLHAVFGDVRAQFATMLARCVPDDRHFALVELLYRSQPRWGASRSAEQLFGHLRPMARLVGMNDAQFKSCVESKELYQGLTRLRQELDAKYKIRSTPTFVINGKRLIGVQPFEEFDKLMKPMIKADASGAK